MCPHVATPHVRAGTSPAAEGMLRACSHAEHMVPRRKMGGCGSRAQLEPRQFWQGKGDGVRKVNTRWLFQHSTHQSCCNSSEPGCGACTLAPLHQKLFGAGVLYLPAQRFGLHRSHKLPDADQTAGQKMLAAGDGNLRVIVVRRGPLGLPGPPSCLPGALPGLSVNGGSQNKLAWSQQAQGLGAGALGAAQKPKLGRRSSTHAGRRAASAARTH